MFGQTRTFIIAVLSAALLANCSQETIPDSTLGQIYTIEQAQQGENLFDSLCARCHSISEFSGRSFDTIWVGTPLSALYVRIANTMPLDQPGSLSNNQALALTSHILASNGMPPGNKPLKADLDWLTDILVVNRQTLD